MDEAFDFLKKYGIFFLSTVEDGEPRVRPFGALAKFEGKMYFCTNNKKSVYQQLIAHPEVQIANCGEQGKWMRVTCKAVRDEGAEAKQAMIEQNPVLANMYKADDGLFEVFYLADGKAQLCNVMGQVEKEYDL